MRHAVRASLAAGAAGAGAYVLLRASRLKSRQDARQERLQEGPRIVILGAGFAGLTVARALRRRLDGYGQILLIDRHNYHLFTPLLYQVAACEVDPHAVAYPVRHFAGRHGVEFRSATVIGIDFDARRVQLDSGYVEYDYLVIALGSATDFFGNEVVQEHALPLKSLEDGVRIRHRVIDVLEQAVETSDPDERRALLTFVVVGGGATGVELAGALATLLQQVLPSDYPTLYREEPRVLVIEREGRLLGPMSERMAALALRELRAAGVEVWLNATVRDLEPDGVHTEDGRSLRARTILWTTGVRAPEVVASLAASHGTAGSVAVDEYLQVRGRPGVYAAGDNAYCEDRRTYRPVPLLAAVAVQEGATVAENLARAVEGRPPVPFRYRPLGNVGALGRASGVAEAGGRVVDGFAGWLAWRLIHLAKITSFRNQLATVLDWSVGYVYERNTARLEVEPTAASSHWVGATHARERA